MNKVILIGRLTRDPDLRTTQAGTEVVRFTLAVDRRFKNQQGEREADFISCQAWRQTATHIAKYFQKGSKIAVVGSIQTGSYEKDGQRVYTTDVVVDESYFVESRGGQNAYGDRNTAQQGHQQAMQYATDNTFSNPTMADDTSLPFDL